MSRVLGLLLLLALPILTLQEGGDYTFVPLSQERGAACLDGSPTGLYIHESPNPHNRNFMIYFNGGGFCGAGNLTDTLESCYKRSFTSLGSTKKCTPTRNFDHQGLLSTLQEENPIFYEWTKIYAIYCDGTEHHGSRRAPVSFKDALLYFRGTNNTLEQLRYIEEKYDIHNQEKVVITGVSAGGIATYFWSNYLQERRVSSKVYAIPDSGLFLTNYLSPIYNQRILSERARVILDLVLAEGAYPIEDCVREFKNNYVECYNAGNIAKTLKAPMLIVDSTYDYWPVLNILGVSCHENSQQPYAINSCNQTVRKAIDDYADAARATIKAMIEVKPSKTGAWSPPCLQHGFTDDPSFGNPEYKVSGVTLTEAIRQFLADIENPPVLIDEAAWPSNKGCNGLNQSQIRT